jgi:hypothetical protein
VSGHLAPEADPMLCLTLHARESLAADNCLVLDLPDGRRVRVWLKPTNSPGRVKLVIDSPHDVRIRRGEHLTFAELDAREGVSP